MKTAKKATVNPATCTPAQVQFQQILSGNITKEEMATLWDLVRPYGYKLIRDMTSQYHPSTHDLEELRQEVAMAFVNDLPKYDPWAYAPTTYFYYGFKHVIWKYIQDKYRHMKIGEARKYDLVKRTLNEAGGNMSIKDLAEATGLSEKQVKRLLDAQYSVCATPLEDMAEWVPASGKSVEDTATDSYAAESILLRASAILTKEEKAIFITWINPEGSNYTPYTSLAKQFGSSAPTIRKKIAEICEKLR